MRPTMKYSILFFIMLLAGYVCTTSCEPTYTDYDTTAVVQLEVPDSLTLVKMQGTITLRNLSNGYRYASSAFQQSSVQIPLMRGAYSLDAEGELVFRNKKDKTNKEHTKNFRATIDYVGVIKHPTAINVKIILM